MILPQDVSDSEIFTAKWVIFLDYFTQAEDSELLHGLEECIDSGSIDEDILCVGYDSSEGFAKWLEVNNTKLTCAVYRDLAANSDNISNLIHQLASGGLKPDFRQLFEDLDKSYKDKLTFAEPKDFNRHGQGLSSKDSNHINELGKFIRYISIQENIRMMCGLNDSKRAEEIVKAALFVSRYRRQKTLIISHNPKLPEIVKRAVEHTKVTPHLNSYQRNRALEYFRDYKTVVMGCEGHMLADTEKQLS